MRGDTEVTNSEDVIDSREVIERLAYLQDQEDKDTDELAEELMLGKLDDEGRDYIADWQHGETLVRGTYFEQYAEELAADIGAIDSDAKWPNNHIDWKAAADELKQDYTELDFGGVPYFAR